MVWSKWKELNEYNLKDIPKKLPGAYQMRWHNKTIRRLLKDDKEGILAIGESRDLRKRIGQFYRSITPNYKSASHAEGNRFYKLRLGDVIKKVDFMFIKTDNKKAAIIKQNKLLEKYQWKFGELPPLNNSGGY